MRILTPSSVAFVSGGIFAAAAFFVGEHIRAPREPVTLKECATKVIVFEFASGDRVICAPAMPEPAKPKKGKGAAVENIPA